MNYGGIPTPPAGNFAEIASSSTSRNTSANMFPNHQWQRDATRMTNNPHGSHMHMPASGWNQSNTEHAPHSIVPPPQVITTPIFSNSNDLADKWESKSMQETSSGTDLKASGKRGNTFPFPAPKRIKHKPNPVSTGHHNLNLPIAFHSIPPLFTPNVAAPQLNFLQNSKDNKLQLQKWETNSDGLFFVAQDISEAGSWSSKDIECTTLKKDFSVKLPNGEIDAGWRFEVRTSLLIEVPKKSSNLVPLSPSIRFLQKSLLSRFLNPQYVGGATIRSTPDWLAHGSADFERVNKEWRSTEEIPVLPGAPEKMIVSLGPLGAYHLEPNWMHATSATTDEFLTRLIMVVPDALKGLMQGVSSQSGHTVPLMIGLKDTKLLDRLVVLNEMLSKDTFDSNEFFDRAGVSESFPAEFLRTINAEFANSKVIVNGAVGRHLTIVSVRNGKFLVAAHRLENKPKYVGGSSLINRGLSGQPYQVGVNILHESILVSDTEPENADDPYFESDYAAGLSLFRCGNTANCFALDIESQPIVMKDTEYGYNFFFGIHTVEADEVFVLSRDDYFQFCDDSDPSLYKGFSRLDSRIPPAKLINHFVQNGSFAVNVWNNLPSSMRSCPLWGGFSSGNSSVIFGILEIDFSIVCAFFAFTAAVKMSLEIFTSKTYSWDDLNDVKKTVLSFLLKAEKISKEYFDSEVGRLISDDDKIEKIFLRALSNFGNWQSMLAKDKVWPNVTSLLNDGPSQIRTYLLCFCRHSGLILERDEILCAVSASFREGSEICVHSDPFGKNFILVQPHKLYKGNLMKKKARKRISKFGHSAFDFLQSMI